jgi:adenylate cyclase
MRSGACLRDRTRTLLVMGMMTLAAPALAGPALAGSASAGSASTGSGETLGPYARSAAEYDYSARGLRLYHQYTPAGNVRARETFERGLKDFPDSVWLKNGLTWTYIRDLSNLRSKDPAGDIDRAYRLATEASVANAAVGNAAWPNHWALVPLSLYHDHDAARAIAEAKIVDRMMPDDARARADLAYWVALAGDLPLATEWAEWAVRQEPDGPKWMAANLGVIDWLAGRYPEALPKLLPAKKVHPDFVAITYVALGQPEAARATVAEWRKADPSVTVAKMAVFTPMAPAVLQKYLDGLRKAGLPES